MLYLFYETKAGDTMAAATIRIWNFMQISVYNAGIVNPVARSILRICQGCLKSIPILSFEIFEFISEDDTMKRTIASF